MKSLSVVVTLIFTLASAGLGDDFKTLDGKEYKNVTVSRAEPDGIVVTSDSGIIKLYFAELPQDVRAKFNYDPVKAREFAAADARQQQLLYEQTQRDRAAIAQQQAAAARAEQQSKATTTKKVIAQQNAGLLVKPGVMTAAQIAENPFSLRGYIVEMKAVKDIEKREVAKGVYRVEMWADPGFLVAEMTAAQCDSVANARRMFVRVKPQEEYHGAIPIEVVGSAVTYEGLSRVPTFYWK